MAKDPYDDPYYYHDDYDDSSMRPKVPWIPPLPKKPKKAKKAKSTYIPQSQETLNDRLTEEIGKVLKHILAIEAYVVGHQQVIGELAKKVIALEDLVMGRSRTQSDPHPMAETGTPVNMRPTMEEILGEVRKNLEIHAFKQEMDEPVTVGNLPAHPGPPLRHPCDECVQATQLGQPVLDHTCGQCGFEWIKNTLNKPTPNGPELRITRKGRRAAIEATKAKRNRK